MVSPQSVGMHSQPLDEITPLVLGGIHEGKLPGCVICIGRRDAIVYLEAFGNRKVGEQPEPMTIDTIFDLASLTKPLATATSIMQLVEEGTVGLNDKVAKHLPEFAAHGKSDIRVQDMLVHQSGLTPDNPMADYRDGSEHAWQRICQLSLIAPVGKEFKYSDVNFIVLAELVKRLSGKDIDAFSSSQIFQPLGMQETGFNPAEALRRRAAPTQRRNDRWMRGEVHDPRAYALSGIAGHAGLFSSARDLTLYAHMMLSQGESRLGGEPVRVLQAQTIATMTAAHPVSSGIRGLGWDKQTGYSSNRGKLFSASAFGHGGFTGTVFWIDPELDLFFIFLSNRVHPDGKGSVNHLAGQIANLAAQAVIRGQPTETR